MKYKRVLLKLSGEALAGDDHFGINANTVADIARQIKEAKVAEIKEKLEKAQGVVLASYQGLTVEEDTMLRKSLR